MTTDADGAKRKALAQGDILLLPVADAEIHEHAAPAFEETIVLAVGERTGHQHAFYGGAAKYLGNPGNIPRELYIGHVEIAPAGAILEHGPGPGRRGDHDPINVPAGTYIALRQREYTGRDSARQVND
jgi:hypothetical protein